MSAGAPAPRANPDLLGHAQAEADLLRAARDDRLPHALILAGPDGVGKATLAFRLARFLLAGGAAPADAGPSLFGAPPPAPTSLAVAANHPVGARIAASGHADLMTIERQFDETRGRLQAEIPAEQARRIAPFLRLTAGEGGWRIVVVDGADALNRTGQNALLKILEEPPRRALLILTAAQTGRLLPTIRSRCRVVTLAPLPGAVLVEWLGRVRPDLSAGDRVALAGLGEGSPGRALALAEAGGLPLFRELLELFGRLAAGHVAELHGFADRLARADADATYRTITDLWVWWLRRLTVAAAAGRLEALSLPGEGALARALLTRAGPAAWLALWERTASLFTDTDLRSLDRKQALLRAGLALAAS